jgi:hypothetical protein
MKNTDALKNKIRNILLEKLKYPEDNQIQQRGIADKIEQMCNDIFGSVFEDVTPARSRRSIEDVMIGDCYVDHKTSDYALEFKMPNLISIDRLRKLDKPLLYNFIKYDSVKKQILDVVVLDVYELNWEHLKIQNLGAGQLQIKDMISFYESPKTSMTKEEWIERLKKEAVVFYDNLVRKTEKRKKQWL